MLFHLVSRPPLLVSSRARARALSFPSLSFPAIYTGNISRGLCSYKRVHARSLNHLNILMEKAAVSRFSRHVHNSLGRSKIYISSGNGSRLSPASLSPSAPRSRSAPCNWIVPFRSIFDDNNDRVWFLLIREWDSRMGYFFFEFDTAEFLAKRKATGDPCFVRNKLFPSRLRCR